MHRGLRAEEEIFCIWPECLLERRPCIRSNVHVLNRKSIGRHVHGHGDQSLLLTPET